METAAGIPGVSAASLFGRALPTRQLRAFCDFVYEHFESWSVHAFGLTDGVLARVETPERKRWHRPRLAVLAPQIVELQRSASALGQDMYRETVGRGDAPPWVEQNLATLELIERKMYNGHDLTENLQLAFAFLPRILPDLLPAPRRR